MSDARPLPPPGLARGQVVVLWVDPEGEGPAEEAQELLDDGERRRAEALKRESVRREYLCARRLQRLALSRCVGVDPRAWRFAATPAGRPEVAAPAAYARLRFSLTHTRGLVACAVCWDAAIGVDAEALDRAVEVEALAARFFAAEETDGLRSLPSEARRRRFFALWTLKEACLKALGTGLSTPLDAVRFGWGADGAIEAAFAPGLGRDAGRWQFEAHEPKVGHALALAIDAGGFGRFETRLERLEERV